MPFIDWREEYCLGDASIDRQHEALVEMVNRMYDAHAFGSPRPVLQRVMSDLVSYTTYHFKAETQHMLAMGYPGLSAHEARHGELLQVLSDRETGLNNGQEHVDEAWFEHLRHWLLDHIQSSDAEYARYHQARRAASRADVHAPLAY